MGAIQSAINSMLGSTARAAIAIRGYQTLQGTKASAKEKITKKPIEMSEKSSATSIQDQAAAIAQQSAQNAVNAKLKQRRNFMEYLKKQPTSLGGNVGDLAPATQKLIARQYTPTMRCRLMDAADKEKSNGKHK